MSPVNFLIILVGIVFFFFIIDAFFRGRMNGLHFLVFFFGTLGVIAIIVFPPFAQLLEGISGATRVSDVIVYFSVIFLAYLYFQLLHRLRRHELTSTHIVREIAVSSAQGTLKESPYVFVIPCYNEGGGLVNVISTVLAAGHNVVLVDDGSRHMPPVGSFLEKEGFTLLKHSTNLGQGAALETGHEYIRRNPGYSQWVVHFDADGQHHLEDLKTFENALRERPSDVLLGSRFLKDGNNVPWLRKIVLKVAIYVNYALTGMKLSDAHNGFRVLRVDILNDFRLQSNRMEHASEVLQLIHKYHFSHQEVPVKITYTKETLAKGQKTSNAIVILGKILYEKFFYR